MTQVLIIHGGNSFSDYSDYLSDLKNKKLDYQRLTHPYGWKDSLYHQLPNFEILTPSMPTSQNAVYEEWVLYFEKLIPFFKKDTQIVGHSLGAMFLAKYLHDSPLEKPVHRLILISGGYNDDSKEDLGSFEVLSATNLDLSAKEIHLFHSKDDPVVDFEELSKFQSDLPRATTHVFADRGHFTATTFPELVELLKQK